MMDIHQEIILAVYRECFGEIGKQTSLGDILSKAGEAYAAISYINKAAFSSSYIEFDHVCVYYMAEWMIANIDNAWMRRLSQEELAGKITDQILDYYRIANNKHEIEVFATVSDEINKSLKTRAHQIIHGAATACAATAGAMAQGATVGADAPFLTGIQTAMVVALAALFDRDLDEADALAYLGTQAGVSIGVGGAKAILGIFPGIGNFANAAVTFIHTETLGWTAFDYFRET